MSTFIIHFLIPPLMILATGYFRARHVWAFVWVGIVSDLDYIGWMLYVNDIVPVNTHRAFLHNVWFLLILLGISWRKYSTYAQGRSAIPGGLFHAFAQTRPGAGWLLATFYYFSHLLLDSFQGGIVPLWPVLNYNVFIEFELLVNTSTQEVIPQTEVQAVPGGAPEVTPVYRWLSSEQFAFILLLISTLSVAALWRHFGQARTVRVVRAVLVEPAPQPPFSTVDDPKFKT